MKPSCLEYFEVLAWHPDAQTERLESLTGYIKCVLFENDIYTLPQAAKILFPHQPIRVIRDLADYTPTNLTIVARALAKPDTDLQDCTFYHVVRKFARATNPQSQSRFLSGLIASHLRYCASCLRDFGIFSLLWRFKSLEHCHIHNEKIVENCPQCNRFIPILSSKLNPYECPFCKNDLRTVINPVETSVDNYAIGLIAFLLRPSSWEENASNIVVNVGYWLKTQRRNHEISRKSISEASGISLNTIQGIERGNLNNGATLKAYLAYCDFLKIDLQEAFMKADSPEKPTEDRILSQTREAMSEMLVKNQPIKIGSVAKQMSVSEPAIRNHKHVYKLILRVKSFARLTKMQSLEKLALIAARNIKHNRGYASQRAVSKYLGIPRRTLRGYSQIIDTIKKVNDEF